MKTKFRNSCPMWAKELWPEQLESVIQWFIKHYPSVNLRQRVEYEVSGGCIKSRHYRHTRPAKILICIGRPDVFWFYERAVKQVPGLSRQVNFPVPKAARICLPLVHELTHQLQMVRGIRYGNETDTTINELAWLKENQPELFRACWKGQPLDVGPTRLERGEFHPAILVSQAGPT